MLDARNAVAYLTNATPEDKECDTVNQENKRFASRMALAHSLSKGFQNGNDRKIAPKILLT